MVEYLQFFGGVAFTVVAIIVRDAVLKTTFKHNIQALSEKMAYQENLNRAQEARITTNRETTLEMKTSMLNLRERFDDLYILQKEEVKSIQQTLIETNQRFASLDATLKGLTKWLERVDNKLEHTHEKNSS